MARLALRKKLVLLALAGVVLVGVTGLVFLRLTAAAQPPDPDRAQLPARFGDFSRKPLFAGELNGFTFFNPADFDHDALLRQWSDKCRRTGVSSNIRDAAAEEVAGSRLNFTPGYLPPGTKLLGTRASACEDQVINVGRMYLIGRPDGQRAFVNILRQAGPPLTPAVAPGDYLRPTVVGGRPAVILEPLVSGAPMVVFMRDQLGMWQVACRNLPEAECVRIAEGVR
jgi:hypothetical protein